VKLTVIDNAIGKNYQNLIKENFSNHKIAWYFTENITKQTSNIPSSGFSHTIFKDSNPTGPFFNLVLPILLEGLDKYQEGLEIKDLYRIRAAMFIKDQTSTEYNEPHIDHEFKHYTMIYYILDSDGPTRIFSDEQVIEEIEPKQGRVIFFPGDTYHASSSPKKHSRRMVINYNFMI
tara:strand:+ start:22 stop:549 length:528 start_codon:yes stop_codon:yes gene_type:complete